jgi:hypothetical protein
MVISYLARVPDKETVQCTVAPTVSRAPVGGAPLPDLPYLHQDFSMELGAYLVGRFSDKPARDVCSNYYSSRGKLPPYLALARCGDDLESAIKFTLTWGPLTQNNPLPAELQNEVLPKPWLGDGKDFCVDLTGWISLKKRFDLLMSLAESNTSVSKREITRFFRSEGWHQYDAGRVSLGLDWVAEERGPGKIRNTWEPQLLTDSLYLAFVAMVWLDIAVRGRRWLRCANVKCGEYFSTEKRNQSYCQLRCAEAVAKRRWWNETGSARRKAAKELRSGRRLDNVVVPAPHPDPKMADGEQQVMVDGRIGRKLGGRPKGSTAKKKGGN